MATAAIGDYNSGTAVADAECDKVRRQRAMAAANEGQKIGEVHTLKTREKKQKSPRWER